MLAKNKGYIGKEILKILKEHIIIFPLDNFSHINQLTIEWPDLTKFPIDVAGDWGPKVTVYLSGQAKINLKVEDSITGKVREQIIKPEFLEINTPILSGERSLRPFCLKINEPNSKSQLLCYFDHLGDLHSVDVINPLKKNIVLS